MSAAAGQARPAEQDPSHEAPHKGLHRGPHKGLGEDVPQTTRAILRRAVPLWAALMVLLALTLVLAYVPMGHWTTVAAFAIGAAKAILIGLFFMNLRRPDPLLRVAGGASVLWIALMFALTFADVLTRPSLTQPGTVTPATMQTDHEAGTRLF
ncbi:cytochrome C oxidase subunit IV family protein [Roseomonas elaeocarpi]|uniref:Cytochrome C oxidase subunit IV family protein n=1 Tax=Roseomonas elaeocarpi TaxID=907779 RepID=A0ABV6JY63_9PROT